MARSPSLTAFLDQLARRLDELGPDAIRPTVEAHAAALRPSQREAFLAIFAVPDTAPGADALDRDLSLFADALARMPPRERWRHNWRDDDGEDGPHGQGLLAEDLLVSIGERLLAGDEVWAAAAYGRLFSAIASTVDDDRDLDLAVDIDIVSEARNRLLWTIACTSAGPTEAASAMVEALDVTGHLARAATVDDLQPPQPGAATIPEEVRRSFADALVADLATRPSWQTPQRLRLALELRADLDGLDAVLDDARRGTTPRLDTYDWLVDRLAHDGERERAAEVGDEALTGETNSYAVADLADRVATLWQRLDRPEPALAARTRSWACRPTVTSLERLLDGREATGAPLFGPSSEGLAEHPSISHLLQVAMAILSGQVDEAIAMAGTRRSGVIAPDQHAASRMGIAAGCATSSGAIAPALVDHALDSAVLAARPAAWPFGHAGESDEAGTPLQQRLRDALSATRVDPSRLAAAREVLDDLAATVLGAKERASYAIVAELVVLVAYTTLAVDATPVEEVVAAYDGRYRRFSAFRSELRAARATGDQLTAT